MNRPNASPGTNRFGRLLIGGCVLQAALGAAVTNPASVGDDDRRQLGVVVGQRVDGYRGIWHGQESTGDAYHFKYSGGPKEDPRRAW